MQNTPPRIVKEASATGESLVLYGSWSAGTLANRDLWNNLQESLPRHGKGGMEASWDLRHIERLDHTGAQLLWNTWGRVWPRHVMVLDLQRATLNRVARFAVAPPKPHHTTLKELFLKLGEWLMGVESHAESALRLIGQLFLDTLNFLRDPSRAPWRDISGHIYRIGATALPITALVGFLIGVVLAYLMSRQLRQFGADAFIVNILGMALIRELGPVLAAILIAGRSGSAITAQIGVMRVTEELDAMRVMGIRRGYRLVFPRALALALVMPLLAIWTTAASLLGGMLASDLSIHLSPEYFLIALPKVVPLSNLWLALFKSLVFGLLIAINGCHFGLRVLPNTQSLGEGTTASVVSSITLVILVDALFAVLFKGVGL
ncbi:ABC transporter permease [Rhodoferax sp. GW822-FHT02A01]|uniref:MlaE family ABC transporter permease n=1 Tax=Rhodoferax sp. GW822-FHT02A01 TaxID=3141537 RepID=UPI00315C9562